VIDDLFTNTDPEKDTTPCGIQGCEVLKSDCTTAWNTADKGFEMNASTFELKYLTKGTAQQNVDGFEYDVCVKCGNSQMTKTNSFSIARESKCLPRYNTMAKRPFVLSPLETTAKEEAEALPESTEDEIAAKAEA